MEDILSSSTHFMTRAKSILDYDDMDFSTKQSQFVDELLNLSKEKNKDNVVSARVVFYRWYCEIVAWLITKALESGIPEISFSVKRDDRLTGLACYASFMSVDLVMKELFLDISYRYCGPRRTIKCIQEAVLVCFDLLSKNLLIDESAEVVCLRDYFIKAANFASYYLSSQVNQLPLQAGRKHDFHFLWFFQGNLTGKYPGKIIFSQIQPSTKVVDDDVVGLSGDIMKIKERLMRPQKKLDIIPVVGMGGIGKTTLARKVYMDPEIMSNFHFHAWIVVSQKFCERDFFLGLLESIAPLPNEVCQKDTEELSEILYRRLKGWRYFIVLDDIWTTKTWNHIKLSFPDDNNGSRIVLTSRIIEVAIYVDPKNPPHFMKFLGIEDSWGLLRKKMYGKDACPRQLINIGMRIAEKCQGLPLAIQVMAGHLSNISKTQECWEDVAVRVDFPTEVTQMESLSKILSISYNDLPGHLKACFLTMVNFPKNFEISVRKLVQYWTAMGFLTQKLPNNVEDVTMEEVAIKCFENLKDMSLIMVRKKKFDGKAKLCGIHDLLWDLCMREFLKEGQHMKGISHILLYFNQSFESDYNIDSKAFKLLTVLDILNQSFDHFPMEITGLINLRYLALAVCGNIPNLICKLYNLETLINYHGRESEMLPKEIWLLACLRHLHVGNCVYFSDPLILSSEGNCESLLPNLQSLPNLHCGSCTKEVVVNIPNLKILGMYESEKDDTRDELLCSALENLVNLHQLEALKLFCNSMLERPRCVPNWDSFLPKTIKKLTLSGSYLPWIKVNALATLSNLEVLKLKNNAFMGQEWEMDDEDQFFKLKYLVLDSLDLIFWTANTDNFPSLQWLRIKNCKSLSRIPIAFGEMDTLELIDLDIYSQVNYLSAMQIQREQMNLGNDKFIVQAGRVFPELQIMGIIVAFVWVAMRLNMLKPKKGFRLRKLRTHGHPKTGKSRLLMNF